MNKLTYSKFFHLMDFSRGLIPMRYGPSSYCSVFDTKIKTDNLIKNTLFSNIRGDITSL